MRWQPPEKLVFSYRQANFPPDLHTDVEVTFEAVGEETRVTVEHRGFDQVRGEEVKPWLLTIVRNCFLTAAGQTKRRQDVPSFAPDCGGHSNQRGTS